MGLCKGKDGENVKERELPKSIGCGKNFRGKEKLNTKKKVEGKLENLVEELVERLEEDRDDYCRVATGCYKEKYYITHIFMDIIVFMFLFLTVITYTVPSNLKGLLDKTTNFGSFSGLTVGIVAELVPFTLQVGGLTTFIHIQFFGLSFLG